MSEQTSSKTRLEAYKKNGFGQVSGWCMEGLFPIVESLDGVNINKKGGCLEIGVFHGKFYILLNQVISDEYLSYAVDIFDDQHLNTGGVYKGGEAAFRKNLELYDAHGGKNTVVIKGDSTDPSLNLRDTVGCGTMRFVSVDGGHLCEHAISDLMLSADLISNEGVVLVDDFPNAAWLGVVEGVSKYLSTHPCLVPFAVGYNKLYMCKISYREFYHSLFSRSELKQRDTSFHGFPIAVLG